MNGEINGIKIESQTLKGLMSDPKTKCHQEFSGDITGDWCQREVAPERMAHGLNLSGSVWLKSW